MNKEEMGLKGSVELVARHANGEVFDKREFDNLTMNVGEIELAKLLVGHGTPVAFNVIALGTNSAAAADTQIILGAECTTLGAARAAGSVGNTLNTASLERKFDFTGALGLREIGMFNTTIANAGVMMARQVFAVINVDNGDSLTATWQIRVGAPQ